MSRWLRGDWGNPNYYERRKREDMDKWFREISEVDIVRDLTNSLIREVVAQDPFGEMRNWATQMNAHLEGEDLSGVVATAVKSRRIVLIVERYLQFDDLIHLVREIDIIQRTHFPNPTWEVEFAVRGHTSPEEIFVPRRRGVDDMAWDPANGGHNSISGYRVRPISNYEFNLLMADADRYR